MKINESLLDVVFNNLRNTLKVNNLGNSIEFKMILLERKDIISFKLKKQSFLNLLKWLNDINPYANEETETP